MKSPFLSIALLLLAMLFFAACESGTQTTPPPETTIIGKIKIFALDGSVKSLPYDSVTVRLINSVGAGYIETALTSGVWAFRKVVYDTYAVYASRPGYGRSEEADITTQNPKDSTLLTLAEQPHVTPILDSVRGSWDSGYRFYVRMTAQASEKVDVLVRPAGRDNSYFSVIVDGTYPIRLDSEHYIIYENKRPAWMPTNPEFAAVAYNPSVRYYWLGNYQWRYCSEGPLSNVMRPQ